MGGASRAAARMLVVEDNAALRSGMATALSSFGEVVEEGDGAAAVERLGEGSFDLVVTDLRLPGADGIEVLGAARARDAQTPVIVVSAYGTVDNAVDAMRRGAFDFLQKPFGLVELESRVERALGAGRSAEDRLESGRGQEPIVAESAAMREVLELARRVAPTRSTVLLTGETGTGKEIVAGLIHDCSPRSAAPFVKVNCAALPETLLESELFGHERGAFTGADRQRIGRFEQASGGTLFLDEIGDVSPATQAKLLRVLQEQEFHRLGGVQSLRTQARIVAATNLDLAAAIREGSFREDLFFRLKVIGIHLAPLRERPEDALAMANRFLEQLGEELARPRRGFTEAALRRLREHSWPGNVRELRNAVERAVLTSEGDWVGVSAFNPEPWVAPPSERRPVVLPQGGIALGEVERELVLQALERAGWVQKEAAKLLHVSRRKLNYMIQRMGLTHPSWRRNRGPRAGVPTPRAAGASRPPAGRSRQGDL